MGKEARILSIGQVSKRTGLSLSAIRFYEDKELIFPARNSGGQRRFRASDIRRLSFIMISQHLGFSLGEIKSQLSKLPAQRTPTQKDWEKISETFRKMIEERIDIATRMRDRLDGCIGCGCLSLTQCALYNSNDKLAVLGAGPRHVLDR